MKKISSLIIILLGIIFVVYWICSSSNPSSNGKAKGEGAAPPMINVNGVVYLITEEFYDVDEEKLQKIGVVEKLLKSGLVEPTHPSGTANYYPVGSEIFVIDGQEGVIVKLEGDYAGYDLLDRTE